MKYEINIDQLGETLSKQARAANRETIKYYGSEQADFRSRERFISQVSLIRGVGVPVEILTNEDPGKELYTGIRLVNKLWTI